MDAKPLPIRPSLEQFRKQAKGLFKARRSPESIRRFKKFHPRLAKLSELEIAHVDLALADAQWVIAREHAFESWPRFSRHLQELSRLNSPVSRFELAADAVVTGDLLSLKHLLQDDTTLVHARSTRGHRAPLIHYVAANGVENFRQKTPKNILETARLLLSAGADVDAVTEEYGSASTALGLTATSYHPAKAGVQLDLLQLLLDAGANIDGAPGGWNPLISALHNGRGKAAEFLAQHGARLDLEGSAGTGRVDVLSIYLDEACRPQNGASQEQLNHGFTWACEYGQTSVVSFLLARGFKPDRLFMQGETGLHWAAFGGHAAIVDLLINAGEPINVKDQVHGGTPLGWCLYGWNDPAPEFAVSRYDQVAERLVQSGATVDWEWIESPNRGTSLGARLRADPRMRAALQWGVD